MENKEFIVSIPPTGQEVEELAYRMMSEGGVLDLVIRSASEEEDASEPLSMRINQHSRDELGGIMIAGYSVEGSIWTSVHIPRDRQSPATGKQE